eukprot:11932299-Alexandrium_andersonii.AAC.1
MSASLVGSEMCIRDSLWAGEGRRLSPSPARGPGVREAHPEAQPEGLKSDSCPPWLVAITAGRAGPPPADGQYPAARADACSASRAEARAPLSASARRPR